MGSDNGQRRAVAGGEIGVNGEWYPGGAFIATSERTVKGPQARESRPLTCGDIARRQAESERAAKIAAWLECRRSELRDVIDTLTMCPYDGIDPAVWAQRVADHAAGFSASIGRTLWAQGSLSRQQAVKAVQMVYGRRNRRVADAWDERVEWLMREWSE